MIRLSAFSVEGYKAFGKKTLSPFQTDDWQEPFPYEMQGTD